MEQNQMNQQKIQQLAQQAKEIKLVITDVDGILTDGKVFLDQNDNELKSFNIKDGLGIKILMQQNINVAVITGRESNIVTRRMKELGVADVYQNQQDKRDCYQQLLQKYQLTEEQVAYLGDDLPDLPLIIRSGLGVTVSDGHWYVQQKANWVTASRGGEGAFRELAELILSSQSLLPEILQGYEN